MNRKIDVFLENRCCAGDKILLGISGGGDSVALLHLLLDCQAKHKFDLMLAHVDHGWRKESGDEAEYLEKLAAELKLPFFLKKLKGKSSEDRARKERLLFFSEILGENSCKAVLLAHHADDHAETVLKRVLEGANLTNLFGMSEDSTIYGLQVWRPLLSCTKAEILDFLRRKKLSFFDDKTNKDTKFLRARMREEIIPYLTEKFGKEIRNNLCRLGEESEELRNYLPQPQITSDPDGYYLDLTGVTERLELKFLLKSFIKSFKQTPSREILNTLISLLEKGVSNKRVEIGDFKVIVYKKKVFVSK